VEHVCRFQERGRFARTEPGIVKGGRFREAQGVARSEYQESAIGFEEMRSRVQDWQRRPHGTHSNKVNRRPRLGLREVLDSARSNLGVRELEETHNLAKEGGFPIARFDHLERTIRLNDFQRESGRSAARPEVQPAEWVSREKPGC